VSGRPATLDPRPEIVFFDVGDTLLRVAPSWTGAYLAASGGTPPRPAR
jgi:FMN phosphatase YigB (HAD superfamily)